MIDYYITLEVEFDKGKSSKKVVILFYILKRADYVLNIQDIVGSFFVAILIIMSCRSPLFNLKFKSNPYTLLSNKDKNIYVVVFKDNRNKTHNVEVSKNI